MDRETNFPTTENNRAITAGLKDASGPLVAAVTYDQQNLTPDQPKSKQINIGGAYDFEVVKLGLAYGRTINGTFAGQDVLASNVGAGRLSEDGAGLSNGVFTRDGLRIDSYMAGLTVPIGGSSSVFGSWQMASPDKDLEKTTIYSLGYTYALSKRTNLYALGSYADNYAFVQGDKATFFAAGIRHLF